MSINLWRRNPCDEGHDFESIKGMVTIDILRELEREGYPVIVSRQIYGLNPSGEPIPHESQLDVQVGECTLDKTNVGYFDKVCLRCGHVVEKIEPAKEEWKRQICKISQQVSVKKTEKELRREKAQKLWEEYKYGTSK